MTTSEYIASLRRNGYIRLEWNTALVKWPNKWGFLITEYKRMNKELETREGLTPSEEKELEWTVSGDIRLPPINGPHTCKDRKKRFPESTAQMIGWKAQKDLSVHSYLWLQKPPPRISIDRLLNWPVM